MSQLSIWAQWLQFVARLLASRDEGEMRRITLYKQHEDEIRRAWEYHKAADELLAFRMSYGMVVHSMLLVAFATLYASSDRATWRMIAVEGVIGVFGLVYTIHQYLMARRIADRIDLLKGRYLEIDPVYVAYLEAVPKQRRGGEQNEIPWILGLVWVAIMMAVAGLIGTKFPF